MINIDPGEPINFDHPTKFERLRATATPDPYDPDSKGVPDWSKPQILEFEGFLTESTTSINSDGVRGQVYTGAMLTVTDPALDVQVGDRIRQGKQIWQVSGRPSRDLSPFTGWQPTLEIPLENYQG